MSENQVIYNTIIGIDEDTVKAETNIKQLLEWRYELFKHVATLERTVKHLYDELDKRDSEGLWREIHNKEVVKQMQEVLMECVKTQIEIVYLDL